MRKTPRTARALALILVVGVLAYSTGVSLVHAAPAFVQNVTTQNASPATTGSFGSSVTAGDLIVVAIADNNSVPSRCSSVTDSQSNTYTRILSATSTNIDVEVWYAANVTGGAAFTVTATCVGGDSLNVSADEYSGASVLDQAASSTATGGTAWNSGSTGVTCQASELVVGAGGGNNTRPITVGSGYSNLHTNTSGAQGIATESKIVSSTGTQSAAMNTDISEGHAMSVITFASSSCGGGATTSTTSGQSQLYIRQVQVTVLNTQVFIH